MPDAKPSQLRRELTPLATMTTRPIGQLSAILLYAELARIAMYAIIAAGLALLVACTSSVCTGPGPQTLCADHRPPGSGSTILN